MNKTLMKFLKTSIQVFTVCLIVVAILSGIGLLGWGTYVLCNYIWMHVSWILSLVILAVLTSFYIGVGVALFDEFVA